MPVAWQRELESIVPRSPRVPWLKIVWQPGWVFEPVQRWEIFEMIPTLAHVPLEIRDCLRGPSPRVWGEWVADASVPQRFGRRRWLSSSFVTLMQWELFQETGCYAQRFWIIQGTRGGHKWQLSQAERNFLVAFHGEGVNTPAPGERPYAEWNRRTAAKIAEHDRLRRWKYTTPWDGRQVDKTRAGLWVRRDRRAEELRFAEATLHYLESQVADVVSDIPRRLLPGPSDLPEGDRYYNQDEDALDQQLLQTATTIDED